MLKEEMDNQECYHSLYHHHLHLLQQYHLDQFLRLGHQYSATLREDQEQVHMLGLMEQMKSLHHQAYNLMSHLGEAFLGIRVKLKHKQHHHNIHEHLEYSAQTCHQLLLQRMESSNQQIHHHKAETQKSQALVLLGKMKRKMNRKYSMNQTLDLHMD